MDFNDKNLYTAPYGPRNGRYGFKLMRKGEARNGIRSNTEITASRLIYSTQETAEEAGVRYLNRKRREQSHEYKSG